MPPIGVLGQTTSITGLLVGPPIGLTCSRPGVSRNGRLYTKENISRAVARAQARIASGEMVMLTHHGAEDDSTHIVGRVTSMGQNAAGQATFEADLAPTANGKVIKKLVTGSKPLLKGVSIRGRWQGKVRSVHVNGQAAETADDLEVLGLDFTHRPGLPDAKILAESDSGKAGGLIYEEARQVAVTKATAAKLAGRAERAFNAEAVALRALDDLGLQAQTFESLGAGRTSPVWRENAAAAATPEQSVGPTVDELARMSQEDFDAAAAAYAGGQLSSLAAGRARSPFMRRFDGTPAL